VGGVIKEKRNQAEGNKEKEEDWGGGLTLGNSLIRRSGPILGPPGRKEKPSQNREVGTAKKRVNRMEDGELAKNKDPFLQKSGSEKACTPRSRPANSLSRVLANCQS